MNVSKAGCLKICLAINFANKKCKNNASDKLNLKLELVIKQAVLFEQICFKVIIDCFKLLN